MLVLITYDVNTETAAGRKRLRKVAKKCVDHGQRVQNSVFECLLDAAQFAVLKSELAALIDPDLDSLRFYQLGNNYKTKVEHIGVHPLFESGDVLIFSFAPCFQAVLCRSQLFFRMFLDKLFQICADRFIMKQKRRCFSPFLLSPSSRRAWIEMLWNFCIPHGIVRSPSSRRAWIEIAAACQSLRRHGVALLAEGVDRNRRHTCLPYPLCSRPPRGGRG